MLAGGVFAAVPGVRDAVLDFFGLQGATVERRQQLPPAPPPRPLDAGRSARRSRRRARRSASTRSCPRRPGGPTRVFVDSSVPGGRLSLDLPARGAGLPEASSTGLGLLVDEFRGDLDPEYAREDRRPGDPRSSA